MARSDDIESTATHAHDTTTGPLTTRQRATKRRLPGSVVRIHCGAGQGRCHPPHTTPAGFYQKEKHEHTSANTPHASANHIFTGATLVPGRRGVCGSGAACMVVPASSVPPRVAPLSLLLLPASSMRRQVKFEQADRVGSGPCPASEARTPCEMLGSMFMCCFSRPIHPDRSRQSICGHSADTSLIDHHFATIDGLEEAPTTRTVCTASCSGSPR